MTRKEYEAIKHRYHVLGKRAAGKAAGSKEQQEYEKAKNEYHRAGEELRRVERNRS